MDRRRFLTAAVLVGAGAAVGARPARAHHRPWHAGGPKTSDPDPVPPPASIVATYVAPDVHVAWEAA